MKKILAIVGLCACVLTANTRSASAQGWSVDLGYQYQHLSFDPKDTSFPLGVAAGVEIPVTSPWSLVGQIDWSHRTRQDSGVENEVNLTTAAGGVRWTPTTMPVTPFVHALFGWMHSRAESKVAGVEAGAGSDTVTLLQFGGGVAVPLAGAFKGLGEVDYRRVFQGEDEGGSVNAFRVVVGVRWSH